MDLASKAYWLCLDTRNQTGMEKGFTAYSNQYMSTGRPHFCWWWYEQRSQLWLHPARELSEQLYLGAVPSQQPYKPWSPLLSALPRQENNYHHCPTTEHGSHPAPPGNCPSSLQLQSTFTAWLGREISQKTCQIPQQTLLTSLTRKTSSGSNSDPSYGTAQPQRLASSSAPAQAVPYC